MTQGPTALTGDQQAGEPAARATSARPGARASTAASVRTATPARASAPVGTRRPRPVAKSAKVADAPAEGKAARGRKRDTTLLSFPRGLYGFPGPLQFQVHDVPESGYMFRVLESVGTDQLTFALVDASLFLNYVPAASTEDLAELGLTRGEEAIWMVIASIPSTLKEATVNLKAPLLINPFNRRGKQVILDADYSIRQPLVSR